MGEGCDHSRTTLRLRTYSNGSKHAHQQCDDCGACRSSALKRNGHEHLLDPWDEELAKRGEAAESEAWSARRAAAIGRLAEQTEEWRRAYAAYLLTPGWRKKRTLVFKRSDGRCEGCDCPVATEVHHLSYRGYPDHELLFDLVALCRTCHEEAERQKGKIRESADELADRIF